MTAVQTKLNLLNEIAADEENLNLMLDKLLDLLREQYRSRLARYNADLQQFEARYHMPSTEFYQKFEGGEMGDAMDFFEWAGLFELQQDLDQKIMHLETAY
jgi:hypothetical protein